MGGRSGSVTLYDVARHAGVSLATASRSLNGSSRKVNDQLRERVLASASLLGYAANAQAQAVARGTSRIVAVVLGDIIDPYFAAITSGVSREAASRGLVVTMSTIDTDAGDELASVSALKGQRPHALIMAGSRRTVSTLDDEVNDVLAQVERAGGHVAFIGGGPTRFPAVPILNREGAAQLATALLGLGYRDFAILSGPDDLVTALDRTAGFLDSLAGSGAAPRPGHIVSGALSRDGGYRSMHELLANDGRPRCVFAVTDAMAVGAMAALREQGIAPGTDMAIAGFDDIQMLQDVTPSLTTVALPLAEIGAQALRVALDGIVAEPVTGRVTLRDSTPPRD